MTETAGVCKTLFEFDFKFSHDDDSIKDLDASTISERHILRLSNDTSRLLWISMEQGQPVNIFGRQKEKNSGQSVQWNVI